MNASSLRPMTAEDLEQVLAWRNHWDIRRFMYTQHEIGMDEHRAWFTRASRDPGRHLLIFETTGLPRAFMAITSLSDTIADWGFYIAPDAPPGTGRALGLAGLQYAFETLDLHKVCGQALGYNERSIRFHERLGFSREGVLRDQHFDGKNYHAIVCFGLLAGEWRNAQGKESTS